MKAQDNNLERAVHSKSEWVMLHGKVPMIPVLRDIGWRWTPAHCAHEVPCVLDCTQGTKQGGN